MSLLSAARFRMNPLAIFPQMVNNNNKLAANLLEGKVSAQCEYKVRYLMAFAFQNKSRTPTPLYSRPTYSLCDHQLSSAFRLGVCKPPH